MLIQEDAIVPYDANLDRLREDLKMVSNGWDLFRFECWSMENWPIPDINKYVLCTRKYWEADHCALVICVEFSGGIYAMPW
jgi:hypothetical protein